MNFTTDNGKYMCPCCGHLTLSEKAPGSFEVCKVCGWEDDKAQYEDPELSGGANPLSLVDARRAYAAGLRL